MKIFHSELSPKLVKATDSLGVHIGTLSISGYFIPFRICVCMRKTIMTHSLHQDILSTTYPEPSQTSKMEIFAKILNGCKPFPIFTESSILDA